ncbi:TPA: ABC transporter permease [Streptococcus suis]|nr:ABC transporter permease subunit [Streptococcus suis]HEM5687258.1 ABC transporter permease [Streptococcus suis]HEM5688725.1 ABC transporter permease [Streptococcus suis]
MRGIYIEWLKSKRTKSFSIVTILIIVATLWNIVTFNSAFSSHPELKGVEILFSNQNVNLLMLPIAVCVFAARIVWNEREGQTFKLQFLNGHNLLTIFANKFLFMVIIFSFMSILEVIAICIFGQQVGIRIPFSVILFQLFAQFLSVYSLICIYLFLAIVVEKQGLLLALGLLGGFLGIVLTPRSYGFSSLINPITGFGSLAPYKYQSLGGGEFAYIFDSQLFWKLIIYSVYCLLLYAIANLVLRKRGNKDGKLF